MKDFGMCRNSSVCVMLGQINACNIEVIEIHKNRTTNRYTKYFLNFFIFIIV